MQLKTLVTKSMMERSWCEDLQSTKGRTVPSPSRMSMKLDVQLFPGMEEQRSPQFGKSLEEITDRQRIDGARVNNIEEQSSIF